MSQQSPPIRDFETAQYDSLRGKVVVITGGASGIGEDFVRAFTSYGALVAFGDVSSERGRKLEEELKGEGRTLSFVPCDVTKWDQQVALFETALSLSPGDRRVDLVIPCAGNALTEPFFKPAAPLDRPPEPPSLSLYAVHLTAVMHTASLALHYFRHGAAGSDKHLLFVGSMASYVETPGLSEYAAAKTGVRGLFKSLKRERTPYCLRVNLLAPSFIQTPLTARRKDYLENKGVQWARREDATKAATKLAADVELTGKAIAVVAGQGLVDLEDDVWNYGQGAIELLRREGEHMIKMMTP